MRIISMCAPNSGGVEFIGICDKMHKNKINPHKWTMMRAGDIFSHRECDICELDQGRFPQRLAQLMNEGLIFLE